MHIVKLSFIVGFAMQMLSLLLGNKRGARFLLSAGIMLSVVTLMVWLAFFQD